MADEYDRAAWNAQDRESPEEYDLSFRRARAAAALSFAHCAAGADALYEAAHAFAEPNEFAAALRNALSR
jgi:hypothetical protein